MTVHCKVSSDVEKAAIQCNTVVVRDRNLIYTVCAVCICKTANPEMLWFTTCACTSKFHSCIAMQKLSWQTECYLPAFLIMTDSLMLLADSLRWLLMTDSLPACLTTDCLADLPDSLTDLYLWLWLTYWQTDWLIYTCNWLWLTESCTCIPSCNWVWLTDLLIDLLTLTHSMNHLLI